MCGIVCYFGQSGGVTHVLDALELLTYRAPDSSGIAMIDDDGNFAIRRVVGTSIELREEIDRRPLPSTRSGEVEIVMGHGRWAMVGAVNKTNAHPLSDRSQNRIASENGSHNATMMLAALQDQERWWRERGIPDGETVHRSKNTTEVISYEWERVAYLLDENRPPEMCAGLLKMLDENGIKEPEERALRLAIWKLKAGNAHACAFLSRLNPDTLFVTSNRKPIAIAARKENGRIHSLMVASDVNAALMLWSKDEVGSAARRIDELDEIARKDPEQTDRVQNEIAEIRDTFAVEVIFLDHKLNDGEELFARIENRDQDEDFLPRVVVSRYDGTPVLAKPKTIVLNPSMISKDEFDSFTESHIAEIPDVVDRIVHHYVHDGIPSLATIWDDGNLLRQGVNEKILVQRFGDDLKRLERLILIGEGSSWRDAHAAALLFRELLPNVELVIYRPVEVLLLGHVFDAASDLAIEISWSGSTDSLLKVDNHLTRANVLRLGITGRPQSDLGRQTAHSGGTLDVKSGEEISVATVKGYMAILMVLNLLALRLAVMVNSVIEEDIAAELANELSILNPKRLRHIMNYREQKKHLRATAERCRAFNKVIVIGNSPATIEGELKIEELAQVAARTSDFNLDSLRPLIERNSVVDNDRQRVLFIINATSAENDEEAVSIIKIMQQQGVFFVIQTTPKNEAVLSAISDDDLWYITHRVSAPLQPLLDAPFFFDFAVMLAYARGLSAEEIDRPRNLAKSVTVTGAEQRELVEARSDFWNITLADFSQLEDGEWRQNSRSTQRTKSRFQSGQDIDLVTFQNRNWDTGKTLVITDSEESTLGAAAAAEMWRQLLDIELIVHQQHSLKLLQIPTNTTMFYHLQIGQSPETKGHHSVKQTADISPMQIELRSAARMFDLGLQLARLRRKDLSAWKAGLIRIPTIVSRLQSDRQFQQVVEDSLRPYAAAGYDKVQIIGGGQDYISAASFVHSFALKGFMAEALYTDSAWHGPLAAVGGPDADHDTLIIILATDPLFQAAALVDTQVYRTRRAKVLLIVPEGNQELPVVQGVGASAVIGVPSVPRPFLAMVNAAVGQVFAQQLAHLWEEVKVG